MTTVWETKANYASEAEAETDFAVAGRYVFPHFCVATCPVFFSFSIENSSLFSMGLLNRECQT